MKDNYMKNNLENVKKILDEHISYTCVIQTKSGVFHSTERGVKPLLSCLESGQDFSGCVAADKVIGKAAAFLYVLLKADAVYANIISGPAKKVLLQYDIEVSYDQEVEAIRNRTNTGYCPMETAVWDIDNPEEALVAIRKKIAELS